VVDKAVVAAKVAAIRDAVDRGDLLDFCELVTRGVGADWGSGEVDVGHCFWRIMA
jgi:hypothetical protein